MIANLMGGDGLIVLIVALVVLVGGSQLPKIARNVGLAGKEFRKAQFEAEEEKAQQQRRGGAPADAAPSWSAAPGGLPAAPTTPSPLAAPAGSAMAAPTPPAGSAMAAPTPPATPAPNASEATINLTPAQLDALLKAREDQVRNEPSGN
ncbi:MAG: twin-arginine translocase TatA/TatE family subunit [Acidobacteriota bacterium]|nr:twin-arginine translocase TatA/TatE family subunit [Acidobacteriota bacterium]